MTRITRALLLLTLSLSACLPSGLSPEAQLPSLAAGAPTGSSVPDGDMSPPVILPGGASEVLPPPKQIATLATPHIDQPPEGAITESSYPGGCGYQWAYQDLPELSNDFLLSIRELQPEAQAFAFAFGEDCVHADGSATFIPMETDFNVTLQVSDLADETALGEWIVQVMQVVNSVPPEQILGPRPGRVSLTFEAGAERLSIHFYRDQYQALPPGSTSTEIFRALQTSP